MNALGEPILESLGLGGYSPVGLAQKGFEFLHVSFGLEWWAAVAVGKCYSYYETLKFIFKNNWNNLYNLYSIFCTSITKVIFITKQMSLKLALLPG